MGSCGMNEDADHLVVRCDFIGGVWSLVTNWLAFVIVHPGVITDYLDHFCCLGSYSK